MIDLQMLHQALVIIQHIVSTIGILVIISGVFYALIQYIYCFANRRLNAPDFGINHIRLNLGRVLILGLEFIVAADLIGTTTTPDYYAVGLLAIIVVIRTILSFSINREINDLSEQDNGKI